VLNEIFNIQGYMGDEMGRFGAYLSKILMKGWDSYLVSKYKQWQSQLRERQEQQQLNFYERMKIDEFVRVNKKYEENVKFSYSPTKQASDSSDSEIEELKLLVQAENQGGKIDPEVKKQRQEKKQLKKMAKQLCITKEQA